MTVSRQLHKFGGSSLANPECYKRVAKILAQYSQHEDLIVVSAAGDTTNRLLSWLSALSKDGRIAHEILMELRKFQMTLIEELLDEPTALLDKLHEEITGLGELTIPLQKEQEAKALSFGEVWSSRLLSALLNQQGLASVAIDARDFLRAEAGTQPEVDRARSWPLLKEVMAQHPNHRLVVTGFIAQNGAGNTVLLGRKWF